MRSRKHLRRIFVVVVFVALWVLIVVVVGRDSWLPSWVVSGVSAGLFIGLFSRAAAWVEQDRAEERDQ